MWKLYEYLDDVAGAVRDNPLGLVALALALAPLVFSILRLRDVGRTARVLIAIVWVAGMGAVASFAFAAGSGAIRRRVELVRWDIIQHCDEARGSFGDFYYEVRIDGKVIATLPRSSVAQRKAGGFIDIRKTEEIAKPRASEFVVEGFVADADEAPDRDDQVMNFRREFWTGTSGQKYIELATSTADAPRCSVRLVLNVS
jgi:hypothetical protein